MRRKTATLEATFFVFLFHPFPFPSLYYECNLSPLLRSYKWGGRGHDRENNEETIHTRTPPSKETWDPLPLSKACNPYYEHSGARQHEQQQNPLDVGSFMPEPVYILISALHTIRA
jgi:hypothetical protein